MVIKRRFYKPAGHFIKKLLEDPDVRYFYELEQIKTKVANAVKIGRRRAHLTQAKLAERVGITQSVIARLESGVDSRTPTLPLLSQIAIACGGSLELGFKFKPAH